VDFRNTVVIMTSNLGTSSEARGTFGFVTSRTASRSEREKLRENIEHALKQHFRPEFLNRVDEVIIFEPLTEAELMQIVELMVNEVRKRLAEHHIELELTESAKTALVKEGFDPVFGARPLRRTVTREVENPLSKRILAGEFHEGDAVVVDQPEDEEDYTFARQEKVAAAAS
jgi:ATP-dependent Clp protease ATP-binding subunit ClpC